MSFFMRLWKSNPVKLAVVTTCVLLFFKYLLPFLAPFFVAFFFVLIFHPLLKRMQKKFHIPEGILAGTVIIVIVFLLLLGAWFAICRIMEFVGDFRENGQMLQENCLGMLDTCCNFIGDKINISPVILRQKVTEGAENLVVSIREDFAPKALDASYSYAGTVFEWVFTIAISVIAIILLCKDYDEIKEKLSGYRFFSEIRRMSRKILKLFKIYVKAQLIIILCVSATAVAGFFACGIERWFLLGVLTGLLDMLPFIGSGIVIIPVALFSFIQGNVWQGLGCMLIYGICTFLRQILEPKLIGDKINIYPIFILLSLFFGIHFYNIGGIVLGPVSLFLIREIYEEVKDDRQKEKSE